MTDQNIRLDYLSKLNYAMWSNGFKCLKVCELTNDGEDDWHNIIVRISGDEAGAIYVDTFAAGLGEMNDVHPRDKTAFADLAAKAAAGK